MGELKIEHCSDGVVLLMAQPNASTCTTIHLNDVDVRRLINMLERMESGQVK